MICRFPKQLPSLTSIKLNPPLLSRRVRTHPRTSTLEPIDVACLAALMEIQLLVIFSRSCSGCSKTKRKHTYRIRNRNSYTLGQASTRLDRSWDRARTLWIEALYRCKFKIDLKGSDEVLQSHPQNLPGSRSWQDPFEVSCRRTSGTETARI